MIKANEELRQCWHPTLVYWRCDKCQAVNSLSPLGATGWFAAEVLDCLHSVISPGCKFDPDQIRIKLTPFEPALRCLDVQAEDTKEI